MKTLIFVGPNVTPDVDELVSQHDRSILFEPHIPCWETLRVTYANRDDVQVVLGGCGPDDGMKPFRIYNRNGLSSSFGICTEQARQAFEKHDLSERHRRLATMYHLGRWLTKHDIIEIETLKIDAQGFDLSILRTVEPWLERGAIRVIQCEADGEGFRHYDNTPGNDAADIRRLFAQYDHYKEVPLIGFCDFHPDLRFELNDESEVEKTLERVEPWEGVRESGRDGFAVDCERVG